jgi:hypothetical protein
MQEEGGEVQELVWPEEKRGRTGMEYRAQKEE